MSLTYISHYFVLMLCCLYHLLRKRKAAIDSTCIILRMYVRRGQLEKKCSLHLKKSVSSSDGFNPMNQPTDQPAAAACTYVRILLSKPLTLLASKKEESEKKASEKRQLGILEQDKPKFTYSFGTLSTGWRDSCECYTALLFYFVVLFLAAKRGHFLSANKVTKQRTKKSRMPNR